MKSTTKTYVQIKHDNMNAAPEKPYLIRIAPLFIALFVALIVAVAGFRTAENYIHHRINSDPMEVLD